jgi:pimeloyl-ACP methyl ester carboxylesterase
LRESVEIEAGDGVVLWGEMDTGGPVWLLLVHEAGLDLDQWHPLVPLGGGVSTLALDLRGHGGSDGVADPACTTRDLVDAVAFARDSGADGIVVAAAGGQVQAALDAAFETRALGVVAIGPLIERVEGRSLPKLVIVASKDMRQVSAGSALRRSAGAATVISLPISGECDAILSGAWRTNVAAYIRVFAMDLARRSTGVRR